MMDRIQRHITIHHGGLTEKELTRLLQIADKCPVHRTLENNGQVIVVSSLETVTSTSQSDKASDKVTVGQ